MRVDRKVYSVIFLFVVIVATAGCSSVEINIPLETQPPANFEDPDPNETGQIDPDSPMSTSSLASSTAAPTQQRGVMQPSISVSPRHAAVGSDVTVELQDFPAQVPVAIGIGRLNAGYDVIDEGMTGPEGSLKTVVSIPDFVDPADEWILVAESDQEQVKVVSGRLKISGRDQEATVQVSPRYLEVGSSVEVIGKGFKPGATLKVGIGRVNSEYDVISQGKAGPDGSLTIEITVPDFVDPADEWVIVVREQGSPTKGVSRKLEVSSRSSQASMVALSASVSAGGEIGVQGEGFPVDSKVKLGIGRVNSEYDLTGTVQTDENGQFRTFYTIPDFVVAEDDWVLVVVADNGRVKTLSEQVEVID